MEKNKNKNFIIRKVKMTPVDGLITQLFPNSSGIKQELPGVFLYVFQITKAQTSWLLHKTIGHFNEFAKKLSDNQLIERYLFEQDGSCPREETLTFMENYLIKVSSLPLAINYFNQFIEYSGYQYEGLEKYGEIKMWKKSGGRYQQSIFKCRSFFHNWKIRYFVLSSGGIIYKDELGTVKEYINYDKDFKIISDKKNNKSVILMTSHRKLILQAIHTFDCLMFTYHVQRGLRNCEYTLNNRFSSFAPTRRNCDVEFLVDGQKYLRKVALAIQSAKKQIFITGWWISPQFHLIRPGDQYRLDKLFKTIANRGVKINILVYKQSKFLSNDSEYTKQTLESLNANIKVIRHPDIVLPFLWSHHEKLVIVDQSIAFLGGIDLCYGRYDTSDHKLFGDEEIYPGIEYNNIRNSDFTNVRDFIKTQYSRNLPRLPWHDIAVEVKGKIVWDLSRHFIQYWNHAGFEIHMNKREVLIHDKQHSSFKDKIQDSLERFKGFTNKVKQRFQRYDVKPQIRTPTNLEEYLNEFNIKQEIIQPNSDKQTSLDDPNKKPKPRKAYSMLYNQRNGDAVKLDEQFYQILKHLNLETQQEVEQNEQEIYKVRNRYLDEQKQPIVTRHELHLKKGRADCQAVRSVGPWSIGCSSKNMQLSIQVAYLQLISLSKHYIYIENQFFISSCADSQNIKNEIVRTLVTRIRRAHRENEIYRVYILLPLLPGFAGDVQDQSSIILRLQLHLQYQTISRSQESLISLLKKDGIDYTQYIQFLSLRTHERKAKESLPVSEIIYIHSKIMIVDDQTIIIGSANINDRSMNGKRDSQLCIVIKDQQLIQSRINGKSALVSKKALALRMELFKQHFNLQSIEDCDPVSEVTWIRIKSFAKNNTKIYRQIFGCIPDDTVRRIQDIQTIKKSSNIQSYDSKICQIVGNVVQFPLKFLQLQKLDLKINQKQYLLPIIFAT